PTLPDHRTSRRTFRRPHPDRSAHKWTRLGPGFTRRADRRSTATGLTPTTTPGHLGQRHTTHPGPPVASTLRPAHGHRLPALTGALRRPTRPPRLRRLLPRPAPALRAPFAGHSCPFPILPPYTTPR